MESSEGNTPFAFQCKLDLCKSIYVNALTYVNDYNLKTSIMWQLSGDEERGKLELTANMHMFSKGDGNVLELERGDGAQQQIY